MTNSDFTFYNKPDYFRQLIRDINEARKGERVVVTSMPFSLSEPLVVEIAAALAAAAKRGAKVNLTIDAFSFLIGDPMPLPGPLWYRKKIPEKLREPFRSQLATLQALDAAGCSVTVTNMPARRLTIPHSGRSHIKGAIIHNKLYIGSCNLDRAGITDIMVGWQDERTADWLYRWFQEIATTEHVRTALDDVDAELDIDPRTSLFIDAGVPKQSTVYEEAMKLIDSAQEWIYTTGMFFPAGRTAQHLLAAEKRGVQVQINYSHPKARGAEAPVHHLIILRERTRLPTSFFAGQFTKETPMLHAKVIATDKGAIVGSHNFVTKGVTFGTAEIALLVKDSDFAKNLRKFMEVEIQFSKHSSQ